jgi:hypothetical protein
MMLLILMLIFRYWSHKATSEWLISIDNYINRRQISSLKQTEFSNLIIDETTDISVKQMLCICLRYVEKEDGVIKEVFKLGPIYDQSGEDYLCLRSDLFLSYFYNVDQVFSTW